MSWFDRFKTYWKCTQCGKVVTGKHSFEKTPVGCESHLFRRISYEEYLEMKQ